MVTEVVATGLPFRRSKGLFWRGGKLASGTAGVIRGPMVGCIAIDREIARRLRLRSADAPAAATESADGGHAVHGSARPSTPACGVMPLDREGRLRVEILPALDRLAELVAERALRDPALQQAARHRGRSEAPGEA
jgi:hypothetical protein